MMDNRTPLFGSLRFVAILLIALVVAYVFTGLLGINRLAWVGAHQGGYYASYWLSMAVVSLLLFISCSKYIKRGLGLAVAGGIVVGYLASSVASITMYFQRGVGGPINMLRHEAATRGLVSLFVTHFIVVLIAGGPIYGCLTSITAFALDTRNIRVFVIVLVAVALFAGTLMIASSSRGCCRQIQFLP